MSSCLCKCVVEVMGHLLDFVEDNAARLGDPEQSDNTGNESQEQQQLPIGARQIEDVVVFDAL